MSSTADLSKVIFNPSKSVTFMPVENKQMVNVEVTNNCKCDVAVKFKNTGPQIYRTIPSTAKLGVGQKMTFKCLFKGQPKSKCKTNDRFTVVYMATSKNANEKKMWAVAHKTATKKHRIQIWFQGINDKQEKDGQQDNNIEDEEDRDRQGQMRQKTKSETKPIEKRPTVMMFTRKEGDSVSEEENEKDGEEVDGTNNEDMMTTRPAGAFTGQVKPNAVGGEVAPAEELKTTRLAGSFDGQKNANSATAVESKTDMKTTRPAGVFTGLTTLNAVENADPKTDLKTTKPAGKFEGQTTANVVPVQLPDMKTTKNAGPFENPQTPNK